MKSIQEFVQSKVRRSETSDRLRVITEGEDHASLGAFEARLASDSGEATFYSEGLVTRGASEARADSPEGASDSEGPGVVRYDAIARATLTNEADSAVVELSHADGRVIRIRATPEGGLVLHATVRWIGNALLRRKIAD